MLLTHNGNYSTEIIDEKNILFNEWGLITTKGDETIGWLILDIINHFNACRLKPRNSRQFRSQMN